MTRGAWLSVLVLTVGAWQLQAASDIPVFRATTELVNLNVSVIGADARPVEGLTESQFEVFEDGVPQVLSFFAPGELPLDVLVLLDTSGSMTGHMPLIQGAATRFIQALRDDDRAAVMGISSALRILHDFSSDKDAVIRAARGATAGGNTPLYSSMYVGLTKLEKLRATYETPRRQAMVVLSDGHDTASAFGFDELMEIVRRQAVPIYTIAPRPEKTIRTLREVAFGERTNAHDFEMRRIALETGARSFFPVAQHELAEVYDAIATELAHQYSLGYHSTNPARDGAFRQVALRVNAPGVQWRTRPGYLADREAAASTGLR